MRGENENLSERVYNRDTLKKNGIGDAYHFKISRLRSFWQFVGQCVAVPNMRK